MHVLAIEPYFGGSHRSVLEGFRNRSRHRWTLITGVARHWKWRMRNAPLALAMDLAQRAAAEDFSSQECPDVVFCSEMLDLAQWRGFLSSMSWPSADQSLKVVEIMRTISTLPAVCYFHENQWTYPISPNAREDAHYGYTNLLTVLASTEVWFNSEFHRSAFFGASRDFVARMPDRQTTHDLDALETRCHVVPPGYDPVPETLGSTNGVKPASKKGTGRPLCLGWAARWEHDKRPDQFDRLLELLHERSIPFELVLLGSRPKKTPESLKRIVQRWEGQIRFNGYAESKSEYHRWLREMDVVVSTADHEFFGIAICEAVSAGAIPVVLDGLSYPELVASAYRYRSLDEAVEIIRKLATASNRAELAQACRRRLLPVTLDRLIDTFDEGLQRVAARPREGN